jgi:hypothetical protein
MTVADLISKLQHYVDSGAVSPNTPILMSVRRTAGRQVVPLGTFSDLGVEVVPQRQASFPVGEIRLTLITPYLRRST